MEEASSRLTYLLLTCVLTRLLTLPELYLEGSIEHSLLHDPTLGQVRVGGEVLVRVRVRVRVRVGVVQKRMLDASFQVELGC